MIIHLILMLTLVAAAGQNSPPYVPTDIILVNCGEDSSNTTSSDGRTWYGDSRSKFYPHETKSFVSQASHQDPSVTQVPYMTARIFNSTFTYTFPLSPGPKFLRLYFYPVSYSSLDITTSFFSVSANTYTLLNNFSAYRTVSAINPKVASFIKEFIITVSDQQKLSINFSPNQNTYAFINGIELVSMPDNLYTKQNDMNPIPFVNSETTSFNFDEQTALETAYRLNVGGAHVPNVGDSAMFREWQQDSNYIHGAATGTTPRPLHSIIRYTNDTPAYTAPELVYSTWRTMGPNPNVNKNYNLTWAFSVDPGFNYLVRLHFCETQLEVTRVNQRVFSIFIANQTAERDADVINWSGGNSIPVYRDYIVFVESKQDLWLALHPYLDPSKSSPKFADAILNGVEILKLNNSQGSLAGPNPEPPNVDTTSLPDQPQAERSRRKIKVWLLVVGVVIIGFTIISLLCFIVLKQKKRVGKEWEPKSSWGPLSITLTSVNTNGSSLPLFDLLRRFSIIEIKEATRNFDDRFIIGTGGFGHVYKAFLDNNNNNGSTTTVAIKRLNSSSHQGAHEFHTEIDMISRIRHVNLVSLIGYCDDQGEMILVYPFMSRGNLREHLYKTRNPPLPWKRRLEICIGAARGLHYLHAGAKHTIIHRDVKSANILLDENWVAKISDFGLSRLGPTSMSNTHVSTVVKGSFGYVDPEYYRRKQLTDKSDVYSFGVVLLEVLSARPSVIQGVQKEEMNLVVWARVCIKKATVYRIVDPRLMGDISPACLNKFVEIAESCVREQGIERPTMGDVVWGLEFALQLQQTTEKNINDGYGMSYIKSNEASPSPRLRGEVNSDDDDLFSASRGQVSVSRSTISSGGKTILHS